MRGGSEMERDVTISRRRFLQAMAAVGVVVACAPAGTPGTSAAASASDTAAAAKPVNLEWWRRNYTPGSQSAETITSDAAVTAWKERYPNPTITTQDGTFAPQTDEN